MYFELHAGSRVRAKSVPHRTTSRPTVMKKKMLAVMGEKIDYRRYSLLRKVSPSA